MTAQFIDETGTLDGKAARFHVDPAARTTPDATRPVLLTVTIPLAAASADGLSTSDEEEDLEDLRNVLAKVLEIRLHARLVATVTTAGQYRLHLYGTSGEGLESAVQEGLIDFEEYKATVAHREDPSWEFARTALKG